MLKTTVLVLWFFIDSLLLQVLIFMYDFTGLCCFQSCLKCYGACCSVLHWRWHLKATWSTLAACWSSWCLLCLLSSPLQCCLSWRACLPSCTHSVFTGNLYIHASLVPPTFNSYLHSVTFRIVNNFKMFKMFRCSGVDNLAIYNVQMFWYRQFSYLQCSDVLV